MTGSWLLPPPPRDGVPSLPRKALGGAEDGPRGVGPVGDPERRRIPAGSPLPEGGMNGGSGQGSSANPFECASSYISRRD